jgi:galactokinase/mevalonate kinase-like predicted kinase
MLRIFDNVIFNYNIIEKFQTKLIFDHLCLQIKDLDEELYNKLKVGLFFRVPGYFIKIIKNALDIGHQQILEFIDRIEADNSVKSGIYVKLATTLGDILTNEVKHSKFTNLERERIAKILADLHGIYLIERVDGVDEKTKTFHLRLKSNYENAILAYQKRDLQEDLQNVVNYSEKTIFRMAKGDFNKQFIVYSPLRLGLSSANASDNHTRAKEKGSRALNAGINISLDSKSKPVIPITIKARRLEENILQIRSEDLNEEFSLEKKSESNSKSFFRYRYEPDELQLLKQALVHVGIVNPDSIDPLQDIIDFTGGGGIELITDVGVFKGTGLGTSSILSASLLMCLYRISNQTKNMKYPILYDQSLLLEQSIGFNSGWQDARGAIGGSSAIKSFCTEPTRNLPEPKLNFIEIDEKEFENRIVLFYTGIKRFATINLNAVLDVYLSRDYERYPAIRQSFLVHEQMLESLKINDYETFGINAYLYWKLRKTIDPSATNEKIESLFESLEISGYFEGGLLTGAGGGGFAVLISKEDMKDELINFLESLEMENSFVANYKLNKEGLTLKEI